MKPTRVALCLIVGLLLATSFVVAYAAGLGGSWSGNVTQSDTNTTYPVEMELYGTTGSVNYPSLKCGGKLQFLSESGKTFSYRENITYGQDHCYDGGTIQISPSPYGDANSWNWRWDGYGVSVRGVLRGSGTRGALPYDGSGSRGTSSGNPVPYRSVSFNDTCTSTCQSIYRKRIATCDTVYPPASRSSEHTACLKNAKTEFDACLATCK